MNRKFIMLCVMVFALGSHIHSYAAGWELYDDFNSGTFDPLKWKISGTVSAITVENGRVQIVHNAGVDNANKSGYLNMVDSPETITGIKAAMTIGACTGDVRTRIVGYGGKIGENHIWSGLQLQPGSERIYSSTGLEGPAPDYLWVADLHYGQFKQPLNLIGNTYTSSIVFSSDRITTEVGGLGVIELKYATFVGPATSIFRAIGTRSTNGEGPCTVYIDDVYVLRP